MSTRARRKRPVRDQEASAFASVLADLIKRIPGALAAAIVDPEGEAVDYWGALDPFDIKVAAAHLQIEIGKLGQIRFLGATRTLMIRGRLRSFIVRVLPEDYALVLVLARRAGFTASHRAFAVCEWAIGEEAGWNSGSNRAAAWYSVEISRDRRGRPARLRWPNAGSSIPASDKAKKAKQNQGIHLEVLGSVAGLSPRERGYRVRLESGKEVTLVREPGGFWYADESLAGAGC